MAKIYGHKWVSNYGETDDGSWLSGLHDVTPEQVSVGLEQCRINNDPWPPSLPEFRAMCLPARRLDPTHAIGLPSPPVPREARIAQVDKAMPRIRELLR